MSNKGKKSKQTKFIAPSSPNPIVRGPDFSSRCPLDFSRNFLRFVQRQLCLTPREASGSSLAILSVTAAVIGVLFWRARRSLKRGDGASSQVAKVPKSAPAKTQGGRRLTNKKKSKGKKKQEAQQKESKQSKSDAQGDGGESVLYTNHRYFRNPNQGAVPLAAPTPQAK